MPRKLSFGLMETRLRIVCVAALLFSIGSSISVAQNLDDHRVIKRTSYGGDWRASNEYDLTQRIQLNVIVHDFIVPDIGYAEVLFTVDPGQDKLENLLGPTEREDGLYRGTTRQAIALQRKGLGKRSIPKGLAAVMTGWPRSIHNRTYSAILIGEIDPDHGPQVSFFDEDLTRPERSVEEPE